MTRDEALIRAALDMAADMIEESAKDAMDAADTSDIGSIIATWLNDEADAIRAIDPAEVLEKVGEVETTAGPWALDTSTGSEILVKGGCSVIEGEDARYLLRLIAADTSTPAPQVTVADCIAALKAMPTRTEALGGQDFKYIQLGEALDTLRALAGDGK